MPSTFSRRRHADERIAASHRDAASFSPLPRRSRRRSRAVRRLPRRSSRKRTKTGSIRPGTAAGHGTLAGRACRGSTASRTRARGVPPATARLVAVPGWPDGNPKSAISLFLHWSPSGRNRSRPPPATAPWQGEPAVARPRAVAVPGCHTEHSTRDPKGRGGKGHVVKKKRRPVGTPLGFCFTCSPSPLPLSHQGRGNITELPSFACHGVLSRRSPKDEAGSPGAPGRSRAAHLRFLRRRTPRPPRPRSASVAGSGT